MFKKILSPLWAFDCEWAPDPLAGRILYDLPEEMPDAEVMAAMWQHAGANEEDPQPYLKTVQCRVLSVAMVARTVARDGSVQLGLHALPRDPDDPAQIKEAHVIGSFLSGIGERRPQLVGYNSHAADIRALVQRGIVQGLSVGNFSQRPNKPWEGADYLGKGSDYHLDLKEHVASWGKGMPSLHEMAVLSGIPGKMEVDGNQVAGMWLEGRLREIIAYNEFDALTTYLLWLRMALFGGHVTPEQYQHEQGLARQMIEGQIAAGKTYLGKYLEEWDRLRRRVQGA